MHYRRRQKQKEEVTVSKKLKPAMRILWLFCVFFLAVQSKAQPLKVTGRVLDQEDSKPLPFVNITINNSKQGAAADINGRFTISSTMPITSITFSFMGYEKFTMPITANTPLPIEVYMKEYTTQLNEVEVVAGENPAHRIIKNAASNRSQNNPENLDAFQYTSYNKFLITMQKDENINTEELFSDSVMQEVEAFMNNQHLLLMESASERKYKKPGLDNEVIIANRVSGLENPTFALLANQLQSFSFYKDFVSVVGLDYLNPISSGSTKKYLFLLQDTTISERDSTFVISFQPKKGANFNGLQGQLYITTDGWAIQNVIAKPAQEQADFSVEIQQLYRKFEGGSWFPYQMNYDFVFNNIALAGIKPIGIGRTYLSNVRINPELSKKEFSKIDLKIQDEAAAKDDAYWDDFRTDTLTAKERETYRVIDSVGKAENFEGKLRWLTALAEGKVRFGYFDFPLKHIMRYNLYEGFRLGLGVETNPTLIKWLRVGGNFGYGFGDKTWKYGYFGELILNEEKSVKLGGGYQFDIYESGGMHWIDAPERTILADGNTRLVFIEQFDQLSQAYGYATWHPLPTLHTKVQVSRENRFMPGDYSYKTNNADGETIWQNGFVAGLLQASVRWAPTEKYMQGPFGVKPMGRAFPVITAQYTQGVNGLLDGTLSFNRFDLKFLHELKTKELGVTTFAAAGGKVVGDVPYSYLYNGRSNKPRSYDGFLLIADKLSFETMLNNEFLNDQFVHAMLRHNFQSRFLKVGTWAPEVEVLIRGLWGNLAKPNLHKGISTKDAHLGYFETGLEINKIYQSMGVGAYYRFGPYQLPNQKDNWAIKLSYSITLF